ncbi:MAG: nucleotidyltransferase domain-containing protein [Candidatus Omnitrophica bacterium]|nr:nucleotidyltransferase domain-containing protein [Candidatus Omnitrophota bacterium]
MKIHNKLDEILKQGSKIKILRLLFIDNDEHTGRGIAKNIHMSASATYTTLQEMKDEGLLSVRKKGNAILYKLQEDSHIVKKLLRPLFKKEKSLYDDLMSLVKKYLLTQKKDIVSIALFGSAAQGKETSRSDIDIVIIVKNKRGKEKTDKMTDQLSIVLAKKFSAAISPYILTMAEIKEKHLKKQPLIKAILESNRLIYGKPIERILA